MRKLEHLFSGCGSSLLTQNIWSWVQVLWMLKSIQGYTKAHVYLRAIELSFYLRTDISWENLQNKNQVLWSNLCHFLWQGLVNILTTIFTKVHTFFISLDIYVCMRIDICNEISVSSNNVYLITCDSFGKFAAYSTLFFKRTRLSPLNWFCNPLMNHKPEFAKHQSVAINWNTKLNWGRINSEEENIKHCKLVIK